MALSQTAHTENHVALHEDDSSQKTVDDDVPHAPTALGLRDEHEHQLVLVHPRADPEDYCASNGNQGRQWREEKPDSSHEQQVGAEIQGETFSLCCVDTGTH